MKNVHHRYLHSIGDSQLNVEENAAGADTSSSIWRLLSSPVRMQSLICELQCPGLSPMQLFVCWTHSKDFRYLLFLGSLIVVVGVGLKYFFNDKALFCWGIDGYVTLFCVWTIHWLSVNCLLKQSRLLCGKFRNWIVYFSLLELLDDSIVKIFSPMFSFNYFSVKFVLMFVSFVKTCLISCFNYVVFSVCFFSYDL